MLIDYDDHHVESMIACDDDLHSRLFENLTSLFSKNLATIVTPAHC